MTARPKGQLQDGLVDSIVGARVQLLREDRGLTRDQLGHRIDLSEAAVERVEEGDNGITVHQLFCIADVLQCEVSELIPTTEMVSGCADIPYRTDYEDLL